MIINFLDISGGTQRQVIMLAREFVRRGHEVKLYAFRFDPNECFPETIRGLDVTAHESIASPWLSRLFRVRFLGTFVHQLAENRKAMELARVMDPHLDVLNPHEQISMRVAVYYRKIHRKIPAVALMSDMHLASWSLFEDPAFNPSKRSFLQRLLARLRDTWERWAFIKRIDIIAVLNDRTKEFARRILKIETRVTRSGVDTERFPFRAREPIAGKRINILCHGIFYIHRRFEDVIRATSRLREAGYDPYLSIIGDHEHKDTARAYYEKLKALVAELNLVDRVVFRGVVSEAELLDAYYAANVFVFASHMQTWGIAVFEAMATGVPVVLSTTAGASEVLTHGVNVLLFKALDSADLAAQIKRFADDPALYERLSRQGSVFVRETITWRRFADDFEGWFREALKNPRQ